MLTKHSIRIQTVGELSRSIRGLLETEFPFVTVVGEISNLSRPYSGHLYFILKDDNAQIKAVMFKPQQRYLDQQPANGQEVICRGRITVYEPRGDYQIIVDTIELRGTGRLQLAFEKLKADLNRAGLFAEAHKKPLPFLAERIAVITSPKGAAIQDFLKIAAQRFSAVPIDIYPVQVQGDGAAADIIEAIELLNNHAGHDIIILCRGGGSIEDLWAFNEEKLARAIFASTIPIVSAVGHEVDFTIADFVADLRAPTPTAVAEMVLPDRIYLQERVGIAITRIQESIFSRINTGRLQVSNQRRLLPNPSTIITNFHLGIDQQQTTMTYAINSKLQDRRHKLHKAISRLQQASPAQQLKERRDLCERLHHRIKNAMALQLERKTAHLQQTALLLDAVSPLAIMGRGYAIARIKKSNLLIRQASQVNKGDYIEVLLHKGRIDCQVMDRTDVDQGFTKQK